MKKKKKIPNHRRKERDSNPRYKNSYNGLAIRRFSPLSHLSSIEKIEWLCLCYITKTKTPKKVGFEKSFYLYLIWYLISPPLSFAFLFIIIWIFILSILYLLEFFLLFIDRYWILIYIIEFYIFFFLFFSLFFLFSARARLGTRAGRALFLLPEYCKKMIYLNLNIFDFSNQNKQKTILWYRMI